MEGRFNKMINTVQLTEAVDPLEDRENSSDNSGGSSPCTARAPSIHSISSSKTRRGVEKRVVRIPIKGGECSSSTTPPSDSWAWRKYGQKPIKGSPYPRGYYRCSSKGCPARKLVERSRSDPTLLLVTYSYDHNHSSPLTRNHHISAAPSKPPACAVDIGFKIDHQPPVHVVSDSNCNINNNHNHNHNHNTTTTTHNTNRQLVQEELPDLSTSTGHVESLITTTDDFEWTFPHMETTSSVILDHPIFSNSTTSDDFSRPPLMAAEEESVFADLGELPECSVVFGSEFPPPAPWCGSNG